MTTRNEPRSPLSLMIGLLLTGAAWAGEPTPAIKDIEITLDNSGPTGVSRAAIARDKMGILLVGEVKMRFGYSPGSGSHLHVELRGEKNEKLAESVVDHLPRRIPSKHRHVNAHADFASRWASLPDATTRVIIRTHGWKDEHCISLKK